MLLSVAAFAQNVTVSGTVSDANTGEPVPFASIQIKGTMTGGSTDADGVYSIAVPSDGVLIFSSIGYETTEVKVDGKIVRNVTLKPDSEMLESVVVTGMQKMDKRLFTGSTAKVDGDKAKLDGDYVKKISFPFDVKCFIGTIFSVAKRDGVVEGGTGEIHKKECSQ